MNKKGFIVFFSIIVFASGIAGLSYELLWMRNIRGFFGDETLSAALVIFVYFSGLGLGGYLSKYPLQRIRSPLMIYSIAEGLLGVYGVLFPFIILSAHNFYLTLSCFMASGLWLSAKIAIIVLILIVPTTLIGITLPLIAAAGVSSPSLFTARFSHYYSLNTLGAVAGLLITGFWLIPQIGLLWTGRIIALCNCIVSLLLYVQAKTTPSTRVAADRPNDAPRPKTAFPALIAFLLGLLALMYEVAWIRIFSYYFITSTFFLSLLLSVFIAGFAVGSLLLSRWRKRITTVQFGCIELTKGLLMAVMFLLVRNFFYMHWNTIAHSISENYSFPYIVRYALIFATMAFLLPGICMGMTFPLIERIWPPEAADAGRIVSMASAWNTWGGAFGAFATGLFLIPWLGTVGALKLSMIISICTAVVLISGPFRSKYAFVIALGLVPAVIALPHEMNLTRATDKLPGFAYYKEGRSSSVSVTRNKFNEKILSVNNTYTLGSNEFESARTQRRQGALPVILSKDRGGMLSIGLGTGITVAALCENSIAKDVDAVEIIPEVVDACKLFSTDNDSVMTKPDVRLITGDGREFLALSRKKYGVILAELYSPEFAGIGNLFSYEHLCAIRSHLTDKGVFCQCLALYQFDVETFRIFVRTFVEVFGKGSLWLVDSDLDFPTVIIASEPAGFWTKEDLDLGTGRYSKERQMALAWRSSTDIGSHFITDDLHDIAKGESRVNSINNPFIEEISGRMARQSSTEELLFLLGRRKWPSAWKNWQEGHCAWEAFGNTMGSGIDFFNRRQNDQNSLNAYVALLHQTPDSLPSLGIVASNMLTKIVDEKIIKSAIPGNALMQNALIEEVLTKARALDSLNYMRDFKLFTFYYSSNQTEKALATFRLLWNKLPDELKAEGVFQRIHGVCSQKEMEVGIR